MGECIPAQAAVGADTKCSPGDLSCMVAQMPFFDVLPGGVMPQNGFGRTVH